MRTSTKAVTLESPRFGALSKLVIRPFVTATPPRTLVLIPNFEFHGTRVFSYRGLTRSHDGIAAVFGAQLGLIGRIR
jgi:hypothetical protein